MYECFACVCTAWVPGAHGNQKRVSNVLGLELDRCLWAAMSVLEIEHGSSGSKASAVNH